jgi:hypothetical protein
MDETPLDAAIEDAAENAPTESARRPPGWREIVDNPWLLLAVLFFATAALGLPFLWISRAFSTGSKIAISIALLAWTALILWLFWLVMVWSYTRISGALG